MIFCSRLLPILCHDAHQTMRHIQFLQVSRLTLLLSKDQIIMSLSRYESGKSFLVRQDVDLCKLAGKIVRNINISHLFLFTISFRFSKTS